MVRGISYGNAVQYFEMEAGGSDGYQTQAKK